MRVVRAQARFENLPALADHFETPARRFAVAIVSSQVAKRLFALKDRGRSRLLSLPSVRGDVSTIPALRRACGESLRLRPKECELFQPGMLRRFTVESSYSRTHFASSLARYVTMISAHGRLTFFVFFALLQLREMIRRNVRCLGILGKVN